VKLRHLAEWNQKRRQAAARYHELFREAPEGVTVPLEVPWAKSVYHLYVIRSQNRTALMEDLAKAGIATGIHYPIPLHLQKAYSQLGYAQGDFPVSEKLAPEILSLPMFPTLTAEQQNRVFSEIVNAVSAKVS
jgi:dTDP-4-amino-4,6-dideoxygalactose transaminase